MPDDDDIDLIRHKRGHIDRSEWMYLNDSMNDSSIMRMLSKV